MKKHAAILTIAYFLLLSLVWHLGFAPALQAQTDPFYKGKSIRIVVGSGSGEFYDRWARLLARHMGKYIPGNPDIVVQNMPGAGSIIAANYLYTVVKPDGLTLGVFLNGLYLDEVVGRKEVQFDMRKFGWIGSPVGEAKILYMRADAPYTSIADIIKTKEPPKCGATGTADSGYILTKLLEETTGAKFNVVVGYPGGSEVDLAVEKGEVICRGHNVSAHFGRGPFNNWHKKGFDRHMIQTARKRDPELLDTPTVYELMDQHKTNDLSRRAARVILAGGEFGRPMVTSPSTPLDRVNVLREGFARALKDPELLAEATKGKMDVDPSTGEELQALVKEVMDQPKEVIQRVKKILGN